ncbi:MAG: hypothetical protein OEQ81_13360 [Flavobacteriaceae bacterium]|nr:hypothetical protein [Flavobacteriaceae bacterium]
MSNWIDQIDNFPINLDLTKAIAKDDSYKDSYKDSLVYGIKFISAEGSWQTWSFNNPEIRDRHYSEIRNQVERNLITIKPAKQLPTWGEIEQ